METIRDEGRELPLQPLCQALEVSRSAFYRFGLSASGKPVLPVGPRKPHPRALSAPEKEKILEKLHEKEYVDRAPRQIFASLLDSGSYLCSVGTMYRILAEREELKERRNQLRHPTYKKPELLASAPNSVWSWDITKLMGPAKWNYYYLYVILDIFSRYVVGWTVSQSESSHLAGALISQSCEQQKIQLGQLGIHADRGSSMKSKHVAQLMADLGITKTHSRPHVSNDNPFSESQFKTMKYRPEFPQRFGSLQDATQFCKNFFDWYNWEHYHSGIAHLTPGSVHHGKGAEIIGQREEALLSAFNAHPERFMRGVPRHQPLPDAVWINPPDNPKTEGGRQ